MQKPIKIKKHDKIVWQTPFLDEERKKNCMCLHCGWMKPGDKTHCPIAQQFYTICVEHGIAFLVTRCEHWKEKK